MATTKVPTIITTTATPPAAPARLPADEDPLRHSHSHSHGHGHSRRMSDEEVGLETMMEEGVPPVS